MGGHQEDQRPSKLGQNFLNDTHAIERIGGWPRFLSQPLPPATSLRNTRSKSYSIFGIGVDRKHTLKWLFPQEKATFHGTEKVYMYSENALTSNTRDRLACFYPPASAQRPPQTETQRCVPGRPRRPSAPRSPCQNSAPASQTRTQSATPPECK